MYYLNNDGDSKEQEFSRKFLNREFPEYELFWQKYIVRLTERPAGKHFKNQSALIAIGAGSQEIQIAQLHYSALVHLSGAWELKQDNNPDYSKLSWALFSLVSATEVASELSARLILPGPYIQFNSVQSKQAREDWISRNPWPADVKEVREYRNSVAHGHIRPGAAQAGGALLFPKLGKERIYSDWRSVTHSNPSLSDFETSKAIIEESWSRIIGYLKSHWQNRVLQHTTVVNLPMPSNPTTSQGLIISQVSIANSQTNTSGTINLPPGYPYV